MQHIQEYTSEVSPSNDLDLFLSLTLLQVLVGLIGITGPPMCLLVWEKDLDLI